MSRQLELAGMESFRKTSVRCGIEDLKRLLLWCRRKWSQIITEQRWLAKSLGVSKPTVIRWLSHLAASGWIKVRLRGPYPAEYVITAEPTDAVDNQPVSCNSDNSFDNSSPSIESMKYKQASAVPVQQFTAAETEHPAVQRALRAARRRIERADNPVAYERAIIRRELSAAGGEQGARATGSNAGSTTVAPVRSCFPPAEESGINPDGDGSSGNGMSAACRDEYDGRVQKRTAFEIPQISAACCDTGGSKDRTNWDSRQYPVLPSDSAGSEPAFQASAVPRKPPAKDPYWRPNFRTFDLLRRDYA
jgi:hypothetical protein